LVHFQLQEFLVGLESGGCEAEKGKKDETHIRFKTSKTPWRRGRGAGRERERWLV
jgi:hypothetical protein